ncbi:MAG: acetate/propionate family kinase [Gammaproteobacteria bacterium]
MADGLLVLNAGSSSIKFAMYRLGEPGTDPQLHLRGNLSGIEEQPHLFAADASGRQLEEGVLPGSAVQNHQDALDHLLDWLDRQAHEVHLVGVGHRVLHGGRDYTRPVRITPDLLQQLDRFCPLGPDNQPHNLAGIRAMEAVAPDLPQVACFDTAFHARQPPVARLMPLPGEYADRGFVRYGFHGLSYDYITSVLPSYNDGHFPQRLIIAHLGSGASAAAIKDGVGIATTMGLTALDGLMMGTRSGSLDPGALLYLMEEDGLGAQELSDLLYKRSGLLGVSGISADMRVLLDSSEPGARRAVDLFSYRVVRAVGSLVAALQGLDGLVFTGGIGEHAATIRAGVCHQLRWLGLDLDENANDRHGPVITQATSAVKGWVIPTNEELVIARHTMEVLARESAG